jgi:hypothetical protein
VFTLDLDGEFLAGRGATGEQGRVDPAFEAVKTVKLRFAGVASTLPAGSVALTSKLWAPSESAALGRAVPAQAAKASASKRQAKVESMSVEASPKAGFGSSVLPIGPEVIVVSGAWVSTVNPLDASTSLPEGSTTLIRKA